MQGGTPPYKKRLLYSLRPLPLLHASGGWLTLPRQKWRHTPVSLKGTALRYSANSGVLALTNRNPRDPWPNQRWALFAVKAVPAFSLSGQGPTFSLTDWLLCHTAYHRQGLNCGSLAKKPGDNTCNCSPTHRCNSAACSVGSSMPRGSTQSLQSPLASIPSGPWQMAPIDLEARAPNAPQGETHLVLTQEPQGPATGLNSQRRAYQRHW